MRRRIPVGGMCETAGIGRVALSNQEDDQVNWMCPGRCRCWALAVDAAARLVWLLLCPAPYWVARGVFREPTGSAASDNQNHKCVRRYLESPACHPTHAHPLLPRLPAP